MKKLQSVFTSSTSTDEERVHAIKVIAEEYGHGIDPHSATAYHPYLMGKFDKEVPVIVLETSHPAQFGAEMKARGIVVPGMDEFDATLDAMRAKKPVE